MRWMAVLMAVFQFGCANGQLPATFPTPEQRTSTSLDTVLARNLDAPKPVERAGTRSTNGSTTHARELLSLSPEMKALVDSIDPSLSPKQRFRRLLRTLKMQHFELEYDLNSTTTASEAFALQRGNCISFAALIVALAREVGLEAHFNQVHAPVERRTISSGRGQLLVQNFLHINAEVSLGWTTRIFEFNFEPRFNYRHQVLSDATVQSLYLNNRALEMVKLKQHDDALSLLEEALTLTPDASLLWNSLGYAYRQAGNLEIAELSYTRALALDDKNTAAENNLRWVYQLQSTRSLSRSNDEPDHSGKES
ncbi:transglutaminase domain-containing protein [uncultured Microbulbifer sp.]|uniref:transglutaminase domain-containing protein n=1 Tax=uncultured Microbulbifer sp. TaxID=348147 RepID=UPI0026240C97|nr:transglutaminase domain-containing protein [uncultured Microbulbifer sp.]